MSINIAFYFGVFEEAARCMQRCCGVSTEVVSKTGCSDSRHYVCNGGAQLPFGELTSQSIDH
jgi:hypothetical protein